MEEQRPKASPIRRKVDLKIDDLPKDGAMFPKCMIKDSPCLDDACQCRVREPRFQSRFEPELHEFDDSSKLACSDGHWSTDFSYEDRKEDSPQARRGGFILRRPLFSIDIASNNAEMDRTIRRDDIGLQSNSYRNENKVILKSRLKKESNGKSRDLKVQFFIPCENDKKMNIKQALKLRRKFP